MLSPRRVKPAPVVVMYELRSLRAHKPLGTLRAVETRLKKWRGLARWTMQGYTSPRGETVVQIVGERHSLVSRRDNLFSSWQRLVKLLGGAGVATGRAAWAAAPSGASYFADARILHEPYESAAAKVLEDGTKIDAGVLVCSDTLPLLPATQAVQAVQAVHAASPVAVSTPAVAPPAAAALPSRMLVLSPNALLSAQQK